MAYLPTDDDYDRILDGESPTGTVAIPIETASGGYGGGGSYTAPASSSPTAEPVTTSTAPKTPTQTPRPFGEGTSLSDLRGRIGGITGDFSGAVESFYETAGPSRTFGQEQKDILQRAVYGDEPLNEALGLTMAEYGGPAGLEEEPLSRYEYELGQARALTDPLSRGERLTEWEQQLMPGRTPGEARFEAERRYRDVIPEALGLGREARQTMADIGRERKGTAEYALQRMQEERDIREQARGLVGGFEQETMGALGERATAENQRMKELSKAWGQLQAQQDLSSIYEYLDPESQAQADQFLTGAIQRQNEAEKRWNEIMEEDPRFAGIRDIPLAQLRLDPDGQERLYVNIGGNEYNLMALSNGSQTLPGMTPEESMALGTKLKDRQELMELWFSPATGRTTNRFDIHAYEQSMDPARLAQFAEQGYRGHYADVMPLYADYLGINAPGPTRLEDYISYTMAPEATQRSVATESEAEQLNRIYDLLGRTTDFERIEREAPGFSISPEQAQQFSAEEAERYGRAVRALQRGERGTQTRAAAERRRYLEGKTDWLDDLVSGLGAIPIFTVPATIAEESFRSVEDDWINEQLRQGRITPEEAARALSTYGQGAAAAPPAELYRF